MHIIGTAFGYLYWLALLGPVAWELGRAAINTIKRN